VEVVRCGRPAGLFQDDSKQAFMVETPEIRVERLCFANYGLLDGKGLSERPEAPVSIDIIHDDSTRWSDGRPGTIQLETNIAFAVQAVMDKKIDLPKTSKELGKTSPA
jgi:hypothetical protein